MERVEGLIKEVERKVKECIDEDDINTYNLNDEFGEDNWYSLTHYTAWLDGRGGDLPALHIKYKGKYFCVLIYDRDTLNIREIDEETFEEDKPF